MDRLPGADNLRHGYPQRDHRNGHGPRRARSVGVRSFVRGCPWCPYIAAVLDKLDEIPWDRLSHAYGEATDVPDILRALAGGDEDALDDLFGNIWHQGTVYEATAYAVPFLIELLEHPGTETAGLLGLLSEIADGSSYADVHQHLDRPRPDGDPELRERIERELSWVRAARAAVAAGSPVYLRLLADGDEDVRAWAAHTLGMSAEAPDPMVPALRERLALDENPLVRASLVFAVAAAGGDATATEDTDPLPRVASAMVTLRKPGEPSRRMVEILMNDVPASVEALARLPWCLLDGDPLRWIVEGLRDRWDLQIRLLEAWMEHDDAEVRQTAVYAVEHPLQSWRPAAARLVPAPGAPSGPTPTPVHAGGRHITSPTRVPPPPRPRTSCGRCWNANRWRSTPRRRTR